MKRGHQRGALASGGNVASAEVRDRAYSGRFRNRVRIPDLPREPGGQRSISGGAMTDGLAVAAYGTDSLRRLAGNRGAARRWVRPPRAVGWAALPVHWLSASPTETVSHSVR